MIFGLKETIILTHTVMLAIATNIPCATYDWFCAPGSHILFLYQDLHIKKNKNKMCVYFN